ncbi:MAG: hypothetical protein C4576_08530 [Desulfobacteraceae bacterium]|nr:MAG: hypothetical protein C4576_08530 [Desulfobacteraceae bacterium]
MKVMRDFFFCEECRCKAFRQVYTFSMAFQKVNFSDELIYDRVTEESFECTQCGKIYSREQVEERLREFKKSRRSRD